jgi:hypothetical protein
MLDALGHCGVDVAEVAGAPTRARGWTRPPAQLRQERLDLGSRYHRLNDSDSSSTIASTFGTSRSRDDIASSSPARNVDVEEPDAVDINAPR